MKNPKQILLFAHHKTILLQPVLVFYTDIHFYLISYIKGSYARMCPVCIVKTGCGADFT